MRHKSKGSKEGKLLLVKKIKISFVEGVIFEIIFETYIKIWMLINFFYLSGYLSLSVFLNSIQIFNILSQPLA